MAVSFDLEKNKQVVRDFLELAFNQGKPEIAVGKYLGDTYIQHYELIGDGPEAIVEFAREHAAIDVKLDIKQIMAEDDRVLVFSHVTMRGNERGTATFDLFRLENGIIVEHWGLDKPVPERTVSGRSVF